MSTTSDEEVTPPTPIRPQQIVPPHPDGCDGHGWVDPDGVGGAYRCPGCEATRVLRGLAGFVPPRFSKPIELPPEIFAWIQKGREAEGLYICGPVGTGKTHTAYMTLAAWCLATGTVPANAETSHNYGETRRYGPSVVFLRATTLFDELRPGNQPNRQLIVDCQRAKLLVIDDIGAEKPSEFTAEKLYEIVDERYAQARPFIVTSNVPPKKLADQVGERVASRFSESCDIVPMTGPDRRKTA
ncbi:ATP-binding protein [Microtetraspora sp. AC03309]|uniref:ATP-binding protein n=1 Tax=Microtetraspora sp. AC03309 TaxID=2779376 RepID=UPI001E2C7BDA|nr:ATP-binding protein [Microtetraspora sp. AC03309]MCC5580612.1 ATP-binding protein [Microtetraspora sp. AC03309]